MSCLFEDRIEPTFKSWKTSSSSHGGFLSQPVSRGPNWATRGRGWNDPKKADELIRGLAKRLTLHRRNMIGLNDSMILDECVSTSWFGKKAKCLNQVWIMRETWWSPFCFGRQPQGCDLQDLKEDMEKFRCPAWVERWWKRLARNHWKVQIVISMSYSFGHTFNFTFLDVTGNSLLKRKFHVGRVMTQTPNDSRFGMITLHMIAGPCFAR